MKKTLTILSILCLSLPLMAQDYGLSLIGSYRDQYKDRTATPAPVLSEEERISGTRKSADAPRDMRTVCTDILNNQRGEYHTLKEYTAYAKEVEAEKDKAHWNNILASGLFFVLGTAIKHGARDHNWQDFGQGVQLGSAVYGGINGIMIAANGEGYNIPALNLSGITYAKMKKMLKEYEKREAPTGCEEYWDMTNFKDKSDCVLRDTNSKMTYNEEDLLYIDEDIDFDQQVLGSTGRARYFCGEELKDCATCN